MLHTATDSAFLATILDHPDDDAPRLVYADWLDEQGESDRAEFIRLQVREARMATDDPELPGVHARAEYLGRIHHVEWASRLPQFEGVHWEVFDRGFFVAARFDHPDRFVAHARSVFAAAPIQELRLHQFGGSDAASLARAPELARVRVLDLNDGNSIGNGGTESLMESRHLGRLAVLGLARNGLGPSAVRAIGMSSYARGVKRLRLDRNDLYDDGLTYISESKALTKLERLDLDRTSTGDHGLKALARSKEVTRLRVLFLNHNQISDDGVESLAGSAVIAGLRVFYLNANSIGDRGAAALAESPHVGRVQYLCLRQNRLRDEGALALGRSPNLPVLRELDLGDNRISDLARQELRARLRSRLDVILTDRD